MDKIASKLVDEVTQEIGFIPQFDRIKFQAQGSYEKAYREMPPENFANLKRENAIKDISNRASEYYYGVEADAFKGAQEGAVDKLQESFNKAQKNASSKKKVFEDALLKLNGHDRFEKRDTRYFTRTQVWQHHTGYGSTILPDGIAVYSFALKPEEHQPSGTCNFSRIDNAQLVDSLNSAPINIYAINYNVLRIMSGMGGLAYSN